MSFVFHFSEICCSFVARKGASNKSLLLGHRAIDMKETKELKSKDPVRLRRRKLRTGRESLYLDIYTHGRRTYEYLNLYLVPEASRADREANRATLDLAEAVRAKRLVELRNGEYGFRDAGRGNDARFVDYFALQRDRRLTTGASYANGVNWTACLHHLETYDPKLSARTFRDLTTEWARGFRDYLERRAVNRKGDAQHRREVGHALSRNTAASYFNILRTCLTAAVRDGYLSRNPLSGVDGIRHEGGKRQYLTVEEVRRLAATPCDYDILRRAFLFSCLTGLRHSDIELLTWAEVQEDAGDGFTRIVFAQKKTGGLEYLDLAPEAAQLLGERGAPTDRPFAGMHSCHCTNENLRKWCAAAGISKHVSFHCGRHTFATMMLALGTDIYTVSKLLGHRAIATTQIYTKVLDAGKRAAVSRIPSVLGGDGKGEK